MVRERGLAGSAGPHHVEGTVPEWQGAADPNEAGPQRLEPTICLTADEAYPELERSFLGAEREIVAGYRIFDPATKLRSPEGRGIGDDWFDLVVHVLRKGVTITLYLSDFDPIASTELHAATWKSIRMLVAAREVAEAGRRFHVVPAAHPARVGIVPKLAFAVLIARELRRSAARLADMAPADRARALRDTPGLRPFLRETDEGVVPRWRMPELIPATHHQKVAVFDRKRLTFGGLDLNERRFDTLRHERAAEQTWHDVQLFVDDPERAESLATHLLHLQRVTGGLTPPPMAPGLIRTLSARRRHNAIFISPRTVVNEIARAHKRRIAAAKNLIYIETQFFRDLRTANRLARAGRRNRDLRVILIIPAAPEDVAFGGLRRADARLGEWLQVRSLQMLRRAFGDRLFVGSPAQPRRSDSTGRDAIWGAPIIYVHAKVSIFDDGAAIVSSANLNGRSLYWDTEVGVEMTHPDDAARLRERCFRHWLPADAGPVFFDTRTAMRAWRRLAVENLRAEPEDRRGFLLPYNPTPAERFGRDLPAVPKEMV